MTVLEALNVESHTLTLNAATLGDVTDVGYRESGGPGVEQCFWPFLPGSLSDGGRVSEGSGDNGENWTSVVVLSLRRIRPGLLIKAGCS